MKFNLLLLVFCAVTAAVAFQTNDACCAGRSSIARAEGYIRNFRYADAESTLSDLIPGAYGEELCESLFLLAGLKTSADEASDLYQRVVDEDPRSRWAQKAHLELAKIAYALGEYDETLRILEESEACDVSDEACLFYGLSAIMLDRYQEARDVLLGIRRGKLRTWAYLSLAAVDEGLDRPDEACRRYEALSGAKISPTALYRFAECLEDRGDTERALETFNDIIRSFRGTPEAVLAAEKLALLSTPALQEEIEESDEAEEVLTSGFTIQFGSFRDRQNAIKLAAKIKTVYPGVRVDSELSGTENTTGSATDISKHGKKPRQKVKKSRTK